MTGGAVTALVVAGGASTRYGADKLAEPLGATTVLGHLVNTLPPDWAVVVVGERRPLPRDVTWVRDEPPGGGPLAGIAAGSGAVTTEALVVVGGDMPLAAPGAVALAQALDGAPYDVAAVAAALEHARAHPLLVAWRTAALRAALPADPRDGRVRAVLDAVPYRLLDVGADPVLDVDTPAALDLVRRRLDA
ncbi:molybdenum cofactor guanylyltransferase [Lapillicoccus jejuensis]|uniref:Molybdopterin-guanine dinucleotide biosynthesis protein A n=1 Tax=Lapillicoccus jejuensis TaxID=402171 RepID=A0A542DZR4_9MICO|nr:NTP transferase domain-containing protein [Lapillicoccus jejuensis]TQJ08582.1 molybdopterin-guanine dinucleotide biosynthesis protein A [Lapillicoccus jejuensis]